MKVYIIRDELWPWYMVSQLPYGEEIDIPDELIERKNKVEADFFEIQNELERYYELSHKDCKELEEL